MGLPKAVKTGKMSSLKRKARTSKPARKVARKPVRAVREAVRRPIVGKVIHFYPKISVAIVQLKSELRNGDIVSVEGHGRAFKQRVSSMQVEHAPISVARKGQSIGMKVSQRAKEGDIVFKA